MGGCGACVRIGSQPDATRLDDGVPRHLDAGVWVAVDLLRVDGGAVRQGERDARVCRGGVEQGRAAGEHGAGGPRPVGRAADLHAPRGEGAALDEKRERADVDGGGVLGPDAGDEIVEERRTAGALPEGPGVGVAPAHVYLAAVVLEHVAAEVDARRGAVGGRLDRVRDVFARLQREGHAGGLRVVCMAAELQDAVHVRQRGGRQHVRQPRVGRQVLMDEFLRHHRDARVRGEGEIRAEIGVRIGDRQLGDVERAEQEEVAVAGRGDGVARSGHGAAQVHVVAAVHDVPGLVCRHDHGAVERDHALVQRHAVRADGQSLAGNVHALVHAVCRRAQALHRKWRVQRVGGGLGPHDHVVRAGHGRVFVGGGIVERAGEVRDHELGGAGGECGGEYDEGFQGHVTVPFWRG